MLRPTAIKNNLVCLNQSNDMRANTSNRNAVIMFSMSSLHILIMFVLSSKQVFQNGNYLTEGENQHHVGDRYKVLLFDFSCKGWQYLYIDELAYLNRMDQDNRIQQQNA